MYIIRANTQVKVPLGEFVDVSDAYTAETGVTLTGGGDNADVARLLKHDSASPVDISSNTWAAIAGMDGYYNLTLTAGNADTEGMATIAIENDSVHLPFKEKIMVMSEAAYDSLFGAKDSGYMDVNIKAISEDTTAADNAEAFFDDTGFTASNSTIGTCTTLTELDTAFTDATGLTSNGLKDRIRILCWILRNKMEVTDASGNLVIYKDDSTTPAFTVASALTDDSTTTTRLRVA